MSDVNPPQQNRIPATDSGNLDIPIGIQQGENVTPQRLDEALLKIEKRFDEKIEEKEKEIFKGFDKKIEEKQERTTEVLAIFITLFTFISVNVTIFTKLDDIHSAVWFMSLMTVCSIILVSFLFILGGQKKKDRITITALIACFIFLMFLLFTTRYTDWNPKINSIDRININSQVMP